MKAFVDGDQLCITGKDFVDLQESPAVFYPLASEIAKIIMQSGFQALPMENLRDIRSSLKIGSE